MMTIGNICERHLFYWCVSEHFHARTESLALPYCVYTIPSSNTNQHVLFIPGEWLRVAAVALHAPSQLHLISEKNPKENRVKHKNSHTLLHRSANINPEIKT